MIVPAVTITIVDVRTEEDMLEAVEHVGPVIHTESSFLPQLSQSRSRLGIECRCSYWFELP